MRRLILAIMVLALASTMAPAFGQVTVGVGRYNGHLDFRASVPTSDVNLTFRHRDVGQWREVGVSVPVHKRYDFTAAWNWHSLLRSRSEGLVAGFTGNCKLPAKFSAVYGVRGYPHMEGRRDSRGAGWSVGVQRELGKLVTVHVGHDWDRFWVRNGSGSVKSAGVAVGASFRLGG